MIRSVQTRIKTISNVPSRVLVTLLAILGMTSPAFIAQADDETSDHRRAPNILFILVDDLGWRDLGCFGNDWHETPAIDLLASEGMRFTHAYANAPNCAPSRACLMTGLYSPRHGIYTVGQSTRGKSKNRRLIPTTNTTELDPELGTLPRILKRRGYTTGAIGKWHLGQDPTQHGFDMSVAGNRAGAPRTYFSPYQNSSLADGPEGEYLVNRMTSEALHFIDDHKNEPFFLYLSHFAVHTPMQAPEADVEHFRQKPQPESTHSPKYAAMLRHVDNGIGRIMAELDRLSLTDNTIVVFFSDNGGHGAITSMAPLRGSKGMLYEGGIRVPLIVRWPGHVAPGTISTQPVIGVDMLPTLVDLVAGPKDDGIKPRDGVSFASTLRGEVDATEHRNRALFWHFPAYLEAYRGMNVPWRTTPASAVRLGQYKMIEFYEDGRRELYDLVKDPGEQHDLSESHPDVVQSLDRELSIWRVRTNAPVPRQLNPEFDPEVETSSK